MTTTDELAGDSRSSRELLRRLELQVTRKLDGLLHGDYRGLVPGRGSELGETRPYTAGDDVRRIDWNVTARTQETHVRQSIADRELETHVLVDLSPSLDFGTTTQEKRDLAIAATGAMGFLTNRVGNRFGGVLLHPDGPRSIPAKQGRIHLMGILHQLQDMPRGGTGTTNLGDGIHRLAGQARRRGMTAVISDFLAPPGWQQQLSRLSTRHDVVAIEVVDPRELELPNVGLLTVVDPETGRQRTIPTGKAKVRKRYAEAAAEQRAEIAQAIRDAGADHLQLRTDRDWLMDVAQFVIKRRKRIEALPGGGRR